MKKQYPCYVANRPKQPNQDLEVTDKYSGEVVAKVALADAGLIDEAIAKAVQAAEPFRAWPAYRRQAVLTHCLDRFEARQAELAEILCVEAGKPIRDSRQEVTRLIDTFRVASEESVRIQGEVLSLEISPRAEGYTGMWKRVPVGPCSFIAPFNFPLNLAAHKMAPALAVGCPFVLKPASFTPISSLVIGEILAETDLPEGAFSILPCRREGADLFTTDSRFKLLSFTGSPSVGWDLKARAGKKKVVLELGGNAACVIDEGADLTDVIRRTLTGAFYQSGQSCISVQRLLIHESLYPEFSRRFVEGARQLKIGDPKAEDTFIGPMISETEAQRLESWIEEAMAQGARRLCGGARKGAMMEPTVLDEVADDAKISCQEAFGPVALLKPFRDFDDALREVNRSEFGLQAGIFTRDLEKAMRAWDRLEVGGVIIGDVPSWRVDNMPYGGVKNSGLGREGIRFAIEDMTEIRLMVIRRPTS
jgi:acyl-CoA reductase-like NAD-dependent aldehyde dehydrogenase